jgi:hypothetical protein
MTAETVNATSTATTESPEAVLSRFLAAEGNSDGSFPLVYGKFGTIGTVDYQIDWDARIANLQGEFDGNQVCALTVTGQEPSKPFAFDVKKNGITAHVKGTASMDWSSQTLTLTGKATILIKGFPFTFTNKSWS